MSKYGKRTGYNLNTYADYEIKRKIPKQTTISYLISLIANVGMLVLAILHWNDTDSFGARWGRFALFMSVLGFTGTYAGNIVTTGKLTLDVDTVLELDTVETGSIALIIVIASLFYQIILSQFGFSISPYEQLAYNLFAAPIEENFFRNFLMNLFMGDKPTQASKITAILVSSVLFMAIHQNYWGNIQKMLAVLGGGMIFGIFYAQKRNITANILGHFALNFVIYLMS